MSQFESLLSALAERDRMLGDARTAERHAKTLMQVMDLICGSDDLEAGINDALRLCQTATNADLSLLVRSSAGALATPTVGEAAPGTLTWADAGDFFVCPRRVADMREVPWGGDLPAALRTFRSLLSVPLEVPGESRLAMCLLARREATFLPCHQDLLHRVKQLLEQAIENRRLAQRNAVLARVIDSNAVEPLPTSGLLDTSFEALGRAYARVEDWQDNIVDITNELLNASATEPGPAIDNALARTGTLAQSDRTYVFRLRAPDRIDNTHEWVAPGIAPMIAHLQDMPASLLDEWRADLGKGRTVYIPDVVALPETSAVREVLRLQGIRSLLAVPMLRDGQIVGFMGFDAVRAPRRFLPTEIQLLRAVANAVHVVLDRAAALAAGEAARAGLEVQRNRLHATLAAIPDLVLELDREGRFVSHVPGAGLQAAYSVEQFLGRMPEEVLPTELADLARRVMQTVDRDGVAEWFEYQLTIDDEPRWFMLSAAATLIQDTPAGYVFVIRDVTERVLETRQLKRLSKIAELTSNLVVVTDAQQRIEWVNPAFEHRTGWQLEEIRGKRPQSFLATEKTDCAEMLRIGSALRSGQPVQAELLNQTRAGDEYWIRKDIQPLLAADGSIEGFIAVQSDVTDLKRSHEQALRDRAVALDACSDGIAITNSEGYFVYMNAAHRNIFGIEEHEEIETLNWRAIYPRETVSRFMEDHWRRLMAAGFWRGELQGRHRDGRSIPQEVSLTLHAGGIVCVTRDISERLRLEADRVRLREELQLAHRRETIAHLASGIAHDLNNLLAVVTGSTILLRDQRSGGDEAQAGFERITRATDAARDLISNLSDLGRSQAARAVHDLRRLIVDSVDLLGSQRIRDQHVSTVLPDSPCPVWGNATELLQVIVNLALNACDATGERPNRVSLAIKPDIALPERAPDAGTLRSEQRHVLFTVSDTGTGMSKNCRARLFERDFTTKGTKGSGLGLPIVASILRDNNAALWIDSKHRRGTTVTVAWPSHPYEPPVARPCHIGGGGLADLAGCNILVVDDVPDVADVLSEMLESTGAIAVAVYNPVEAAELLRDNPGLWSALVTDLDMPRLRGTDLARKAAACQPSVPAILLTALPEAVGSEAQFFHTVLSKPIEARRLIAAVCEAVSATIPTTAARP